MLLTYTCACQAQTDLATCMSAKECLSLSDAAYKLRHWSEAEAWAAYALDWAQPTDATLALDAYARAASASLNDGRPRMALLWANAGVDYAHPWASNYPTTKDIPAAGKRKIAQVQKSLAATVSKLPGSQNPTGFFVRYAGRGLWNELTITDKGSGKATWLLYSLRAGLSEEPVRHRGPAKWSEDAEREATVEGNRLRGTYQEFNFYDKSEHLCDVTLTLNRSTIVLDHTPGCDINNVGSHDGEEFSRAEPVSK